MSDTDAEKINLHIQQTAHEVAQWCEKWSLKISAGNQKAHSLLQKKKNYHAGFVLHLVINYSNIKYNECPKLLDIRLDKRLH